MERAEAWLRITQKNESLGRYNYDRSCSKLLTMILSEIKEKGSVDRETFTNIVLDVCDEPEICDCAVREIEYDLDKTIKYNETKKYDPVPLKQEPCGENCSIIEISEIWK